MGFKLFGASLLALLLVVTGGYFYYKDSQKTIKMLTENNSKLETAITLNEETITELNKNITEANEIVKRVNEEFSAIRTENTLLREKLERHDLEMLARNKPKLVERIINNASAEALRCFELLSGASLTDKERNAKDAKDFNSECPWLFYTYIID